MDPVPLQAMHFRAMASFPSCDRQGRKSEQQQATEILCHCAKRRNRGQFKPI
jgi:hypothetical protein